MKYLKMLALAAVAAGALMAFIGAGTASATVLCSTTVEVCPEGQRIKIQQLKFSLTEGTTAKLEDTNGNTLDTCKGSEVKGPITKEGSATETVKINIESLTWSTCTFPTETKKTSELEVHLIIGTSNATITAAGTFEVLIKSILGECKYGVTAGDDLGTLTEGKTGTASPPIFHAEDKKIEELSSLAACPDTTRWEATFTVTEPKNTTVAVAKS